MPKIPRASLATILNKHLNGVDFEAVCCGELGIGISHYTRKKMDFGSGVCVLQKMDIFRHPSPFLPKNTRDKYSFFLELKHKGEYDLLDYVRDELSHKMLKEYKLFLSMYKGEFDAIILWDGTFETIVDNELHGLFDNVININVEESEYHKYIVERDLLYPIFKLFNRHPNVQYFEELLCPKIIQIVREVFSK